MKIILSLLLAVIAFQAQAGDPVWLDGKTEAKHEIKVYRAESCGCCKGWIDHLRDHNFLVEDVVTEDLNAIKQQHGVPDGARSCHTAIVDGMIVEGHVPAQDIKRLLGSNTDIRLLAVPGMPSGGPGMDTPGARKDAFRVFAQSRSGEVSVVNNYDNY